MKTKEAVIELNEYKNIAKVDEDEQFYLGRPIKCKLDINERNVYSMEKCKNAGEFFEYVAGILLVCQRHTEATSAYIHVWDFAVRF